MKEITLTERKTGREWGEKFSFKKYIPTKLNLVLNELFNAEISTGLEQIAVFQLIICRRCSFNEILE